MNALRPLAMLATIFGLALLIVFHHHPVEDNDELAINQPSSAKVAVAQPDVSLNHSSLLQAPRKNLVQTTKANPVSPACLTFWNGLQNLDLKDLASSPSDSLPPSGDCQQIPDVLKTAHQGFEKKCAVPQGTEATAANREECLSATIQYRAEISAWLTRDTPLEQITDPGLLADKLVANFGANLEESAAVADRLREVSPESYPATKASLVSHYLLNAKTGKTDEAQEAEILDAARSANPHDAELPFIDIGIPMRSNRIEEVFQAADRLDRTNPDSPAAPFGRAFAEFKSGHRDRAMQQLDLAAGRSAQPEERAYYSQLKGAIARGAEPGTLEFYFPMSFGMSANRTR